MANIHFVWETGAFGATHHQGLQFSIPCNNNNNNNNNPRNGSNTLQDLEPKWRDYVKEQGFDHTVNFDYQLPPRVRPTTNLRPGSVIRVTGRQAQPRFPRAQATATAAGGTDGDTATGNKNEITFAWKGTNQESGRRVAQVYTIEFTGPTTSLESHKPEWLAHVKELGYDNTVDFRYYGTESDGDECIPGDVIHVRGEARPVPPSDDDGPDRAGISAATTTGSKSDEKKQEL